MKKFHRIYWLKKFDWVHYSKIYDKYAKSKKNYYSQSSYFLANSIKLKKSSKIIDLACGTGALTSVLIKKHPKIKILAIDLSKDMLKHYAKNFSSNIKKHQIRVVEGNAEKIGDYTNEKYDAVFISSALWDLNLEFLFKNLSKFVEKDGYVIFNLPSLVVEKEKGFIFFIEHFFREKLNSKMIYRRIKISHLKELSDRNGFKIFSMKNYSFKMSKRNVAKFFDVLKYRYPFILFPEKVPYSEKLKKCTKIFKESLRYIPKEGIKEEGILFILKKELL